ncbi:microtubule integrity protein mal3, partial [Coemansia nantahalensis]
PGGPTDSARPMSSASSSSAGAYRARPAAAAARPRPAGVARVAVRPGSRTTAGAAPQQQQQALQDLTRQVAEAKVMIETAEKERDFYFTKLREIEVFIQQSEFVAGSELEGMAKHIQAILYSTEDGAVDEADGEQPGLQGEPYAEQAVGHMEQLHEYVGDSLVDEARFPIRTWGAHRDGFAGIKRSLSVWNKVLDRLLQAGFFRSVERCRNRRKFLESKCKAAQREVETADRTAWELLDVLKRAKGGLGVEHARRKRSRVQLLPIQPTLKSRVPDH